jgi:hypothetical protein
MITKMQFAKHIVENFAKHVKGFEDFNYDDDFDKVKELTKDLKVKKRKDKLSHL